MSTIEIQWSWQATTLQVEVQIKGLIVKVSQLTKFYIFKQDQDERILVMRGMLCEKRRNAQRKETIGTLYLLAVLQIPVTRKLSTIVSTEHLRSESMMQTPLST